MLNRAVAPSSLPIEQIKIQEPKSIKYENGLQVFTFHSEVEELMKFEFVFSNIFESKDLFQLNAILVALLREGTKNRTSTQIAEEIDSYGAYLIPEYSFDYTTITLYTMRKYAAQVLPIVHDILCHSIFPASELDLYKRNSKQSLEISLQKNSYLARRLFFKEVFGTNYSYGFSPSKETLDAVDTESIRRLYKKQMVPANCTLFIAGNIDHHILSIVYALFNDQWASSPNPLTEGTVDFPSSTGQVFTELRPDSIQSSICLGQLTISRQHEEYPALQFVNTVFGGYFGSRLMRNIREDKGYTYTISSGVLGLRHTGALYIMTEVGVEYTQNTFEEIEKEMDILRSDLASEDELTLVKNFMNGVLLGSMEGIFSHASKFKVVYFSNLTLDYYSNYFDVVNTMNPKKVKEIAERYFDNNHFKKVIVGANF